MVIRSLLFQHPSTAFSWPEIWLKPAFLLHPSQPFLKHDEINISFNNTQGQHLQHFPAKDNMCDHVLQDETTLTLAKNTRQTGFCCKLWQQILTNTNAIVPQNKSQTVCSTGDTTSEGYSPMMHSNSFLYLSLFSIPKQTSTFNPYLYPHFLVNPCSFLEICTFH